MHKHYYSLLFLSLFLLFGCKKNATSSNNDTSNNNDNSSITIEWPSSYQSTFDYSGGVLTGQYFFINFTISNGSGNLKITADVTTGEGNKKSFTAAVNEGETHSITVPVSFSGSKNCTPSTISSRITLSGGNGPSLSLGIACGNNGSGPKTLTIGDFTF